MGGVGSNSPNRSRWRIPVVSIELHIERYADPVPQYPQQQQPDRSAFHGLLTPVALFIYRSYDHLSPSSTFHHFHHPLPIRIILTVITISQTIITDQRLPFLHPNPDYPHRHQHFSTSFSSTPQHPQSSTLHGR